MPRFCGFCGTPSEGGAFCSHCGQRYPSVEPVDEVVPDHAPEAGHDDTLVIAEAQQAESPVAEQPVAEQPAPYAPPQQAPYAGAPQQAPYAGAPQQAPYAGAPQQASYVAQPQAQQPQQAPYVAQPQAQQPQQAPYVAPTPPRTPVVNPFAGIPLGDYARDAAAVVLLFTSLALPWDMNENTGGRWWAALAVLVSVASLALPYLVKARVIPGWGPRHLRLAKLGAFVPMGVSVLAALVNELVHVGDAFDGGIGTGLAVALAGALLALQPRAVEDDGTGRSAEALWWTVARVTAVVMVVVAVGTWLAFLLKDIVDGGYIFDDVLIVAQYVLALVGGLLIVALPAFALLSGSEAGRRVLAVVGLSVPPLAILLNDERDGLVTLDSVEKWYTPVGGLFLTAAAGALMVARPLQRRTRSADEVRGWVATAGMALVIAAGGLAVAAVRQVLVMLSWEDYAADRIVPIILTVAGAVALLVARSMLPALPGTRVVVLGILVGVMVLGVITISVSDELTRAVDLTAVVAWFTLPGLAAFALLAPLAVRQAFGPMLPDLAESRPMDGSQPPTSA